MRYRITLTQDQPTPNPARRTLVRANVDEAVDAAKRWLRLKRRIVTKEMDRPTVYVVEVPTAGDSFRTVATGRFDD